MVEEWDEFFNDPERRRIAGVLIERAIVLEYNISVLIETYFIDDFERQRKFKEFILDQEFFTFSQKIRILSRLRKVKAIFIKDETCDDLFEILHIRNALAHQLRSFDIIDGEKKFKIQYKREGRDDFISEIFDETFSQKTLLKINGAIKEIGQITKNLEKLK